VDHNITQLTVSTFRYNTIRGRQRPRNPLWGQRDQFGDIQQFVGPVPALWPVEREHHPDAARILWPYTPTHIFSDGGEQSCPTNPFLWVSLFNTGFDGKLPSIVPWAAPQYATEGA